MRAGSFFAVLTSLLLGLAGPGFAIPVELNFFGTLEDVPSAYAPIGLRAGDPVHGTIHYASDTPASTVGRLANRYDDPFLGASIRIGEREDLFRHRAGCCDAIDVGPDSLGLNIALQDAPDLMRFETLSMIFRLGTPGEPYFESNTLPVHLPHQSVTSTPRAHRIFGGAIDPESAGSSRLELAIDVRKLYVRPLQGKSGKTPPVPEPGVAVLIGLGLAGLARRST